MNKITYDIEPTPKNFLAATELAVELLKQLEKSRFQRKDVDWIEPFIHLLGKMAATRKYEAGSEDLETVNVAMDKIENALAAFDYNWPVINLDIGQNSWWKEPYDTEKEFNPVWLACHLDRLRLMVTKFAAPIFEAVYNLPEMKEWKRKADLNAHLDKVETEWNSETERVKTEKEELARAELWCLWCGRKKQRYTTREEKDEAFLDVLNAYNIEAKKSKRPTLDITLEALKKWSNRHPEHIQKYRNDPDLTND